MARPTTKERKRRQLAELPEDVDRPMSRIEANKLGLLRFKSNRLKCKNDHVNPFFFTCNSQCCECYALHYNAPERQDDTTLIKDWDLIRAWAEVTEARVSTGKYVGRAEERLKDMCPIVYVGRLFNPITQLWEVYDPQSGYNAAKAQVTRGKTRLKKLLASQV